MTTAPQVPNRRIKLLILKKQLWELLWKRLLLILVRNKLAFLSIRISRRICWKPGFWRWQRVWDEFQDLAQRGQEQKQGDWGQGKMFCFNCPSIGDQSFRFIFIQARHWVETWKSALGEEANVNKLITTLKERGNCGDIVKCLKDTFSCS